MHNSKKIISAVFFCIILTLLVHFITFICCPVGFMEDTFRDFSNIKSDTVDNLFLGSSFFKYGIDAVEIQRLSGKTSYDFAIQHGNFWTDMEVLKYASDRKKIKNVYIDFDLFSSLGHKKLHTGECVYPLIGQLFFNVDAKTKLRIIDKMMPVRYTDALFYFANIKSIKQIKHIILQKRSKSYREGKVILSKKQRKDWTYMGFGSLGESPCISSWEQLGTIHEGLMQKTIKVQFNNWDMKYFNEMINFCRDQNINVTVVIMPVPKTTRSQIANWNHLIDKAHDLCFAKGISFIDGNSIEPFNEEQVPEAFTDSGGHIAIPYNTIFSKVLYNTISHKTE